MSSQLAALARQLQDVLPDAEAFNVDWTADNFQFRDSALRNSEATSISPVFIIAILFFVISIVSVIAGTIFEMRLEARKAKRALERQRLRSINEEDDEQQDQAADEIKPQGALQNYLYSFALYNNTKRLIYGRASKVDKQLEILNGLRVLSLTFVVVGHTFLYSLRGPTSNPLEFIRWFDEWSFYILMAAPYSVDVFFWISGFLGGYLMLEYVKKRNGKNQPFLMIMLHRLLRLIPLYLATIFFFWQIMSMVGTGPVFFKYKEEYAGACSRYWWSHLLFINNFYPFDRDEQCMGWTWYLPNDVQFFALLPPLVWLLYRRRAWGVAAIAVIMTASLTASVIILQLAGFGPSMFRIKENYYRVYYMKPYMRVSPFLIGIYCGLAIYSFRNDDPAESLIKRCCDKIKRSWVLRQTLYWTGLAIMVVITFTFQPINNHPEKFSQLFNSFYMTVTKPLFVLGMNMFVFPMLLGRGLFFRAVLGHDFFTPFARLSFGVFLLHATFMTFEAFNRERAIWASRNYNVAMFFAWMVASFLASFLFTVFIETPCANLEKYFLTPAAKGKARKKATIKQMVEVERVSFANSFSETLVKKDSEASDSTPELPSRHKNDEEFFNQDNTADTVEEDSFVKNSINR